MTDRPRVGGLARTAAMLAVIGILGGGARPVSAGPAPQKVDRPTPHTTVSADVLKAAQQEFQRRLDAYLKLRADLADKLEPLKPTASAAELTARQDALAAALRTARQGAKQGNMIPAPVAEQIRVAIAADLAERGREASQAAFAEVPHVATVVNRTFPKDAALPTVPPLLLKRLPVLPDNLQYRFVNRNLVLLDGDTQLIVDYVANVLPK